MKVLIVGASSYVGSRIYYDLRAIYDLVGTYRNHKLSDAFERLDIREKDAVDTLVARVKPDVIVHVANFPNAKSAEGREQEYKTVNFDATESLVDAANTCRAKFVFISGQAALVTDNPYGKYKAMSEKVVKSVRSGYLILRPSLIVGVSPNQTNDRTFNRFLFAIEKGEKTVAFDTSWKLRPTYIGYLSQMIDQSIGRNLWNCVVPVYLPHVLDQATLARDVLTPFGIHVSGVDRNIAFPLIDFDESDLRKFTLVPDSYEALVTTLISEIRNRNLFTIL